MPACTQCGAKLPQDLRFCTECGADQTVSFSEAQTFVPTRDAPRPPDDHASDTATNPILAVPPPPADPLSEFAPPTHPLPRHPEAADFYQPPPPRPSSTPTSEYAITPRPAAAVPPPVERAAAPPEAPLYVPPPFPPPSVAPLPEPPAAAAPPPAVPAPRTRVLFPPRSDVHQFPASTRNLLFMGMLVWCCATLVYGGYLGWSLFAGPGEAGEPAATGTVPMAAPDAPVAAPVDAPPAAVEPVPSSAGGESLLTGHTAAVTSLAVSEDGQRLLSGGGQGDCSVRIWDLAGGRQAGRFDGHGQDCAVLVAGFVAGGRAASAAGPTDFALRVWDPQTGGELRQLSGGEGLLYRAWSPDGTRAVGQELGGESGGGFSLWNLDTGVRVTTVVARGASSFAFSATGEHLLTGGDDGQIAVWDAATGSQLKLFPGHGAGTAVRSVAFAPNRRLLVSAAANDQVVLWDPDTGAAFRTIDGATSFAMAEDSRTLAVGGPDGIVRVLDAIRGVEHARFTGHQGAVQSLTWVPGGQRLVSGGADRTVRVWLAAPRS